MKVQIEFEFSDEVLRKGGVSEDFVRQNLAGILSRCLAEVVGDYSRPGFEYHEESVLVDANRTEYR